MGPPPNLCCWGVSTRPAPSVTPAKNVRKNVRLFIKDVKITVNRYRFNTRVHVLRGLAD